MKTKTYRIKKMEISKERLEKEFCGELCNYLELEMDIDEYMLVKDILYTMDYSLGKIKIFQIEIK